jgi:glycosyltransferase involved in cell wall biosynthesis
MFLSKFFKAPNDSNRLGTVSINFRPVNESYGGMNVFVKQISRWLVDRGYRVVYELNTDVDVVLVAHPWLTHTDPYGFDDVQAFKRANPRVQVLLRINECDKRKKTTHMDQWLAQWESISDHTYFISKWLRDHHAMNWFDKKRSHSCIYNGADPRVFHPVGASTYDGSGPLRIVTHHWSDNPMKGYPDYQKLDSQIATGDIKDVEFLVIGRWPADINWQVTETHGSAHGKTLADLLRSCHVYLTGSRWEPCGMHHVEGIQCGLPVIYHGDGGGIVELARRYGIQYSDDLGTAIEQMRDSYENYRKTVLSDPPRSGDEMCLRTIDIIQKMRVM